MRDKLRANLRALGDIEARQQEHEPDWAAMRATGEALEGLDRKRHDLQVMQSELNHKIGQRLLVVEQASMTIMASLLEMAEAFGDLRRRVEALEDA